MGVTTNAVYNAVRRGGFKTNQITNRAGNITDKGRIILDSFFVRGEDQQPEPARLDDQKQQPEPEEQAKQAEELEKVKKALLRKGAECDSLREELKKAEERADKWERLYLELQEQARIERAEMRREIDTVHLLTAQAQRMSMNPFKRLFAGRKKDNPVQADAEVK